MKPSIRIHVLLLQILAMFWTCQIYAQAQKADHSITKIYLVRHAERDAGVDPPLNELGKARALDLKQLLSDSSITTIYCLDFKRNRQTAQPLAEYLGVKPILVPSDSTWNSYRVADFFLNEVKAKHQGESVLFVGNQKPQDVRGPGNLHTIFWTLKGSHDETLRTEYFNVHTIYLYRDGHCDFFEGEYGAL